MKLLSQTERELEEKSEKTKCVQRDLEDQIEEEYKAQGREYQRTNINNSNMSTSQQPRIVVKDVLALLKRGYTRRKKDDTGYGSIEEFYNLTPGQVKELFMHPKLRMKKTIAPNKGLIIVDEEEEEEKTPVQLGEGTPQPVEELPDPLAMIMAEAKQDVEVKTGSIKREELFS